MEFSHLVVGVHQFLAAQKLAKFCRIVYLVSFLFTLVMFFSRALIPASSPCGSFFPLSKDMHIWGSGELATLNDHRCECEGEGLFVFSVGPAMSWRLIQDVPRLSGEAPVTPEGVKR